MPAKGKKGPKQLQALAQLTAVQSTYKAACRNYGTLQDPAVNSLIAEAVQECGSIEKMSFTNPSTGAGAVKAVLDVMAGYPAVKNFACWGCSIGDEGLSAVARFIQSSGGKWWKGSKLKLLEVVADGRGRKLEDWPATTLAQMSGALPVRGPGHAQPSMLLDPDATLVTDTTLRLQQVGLEDPTYLQLEDEFIDTKIVHGAFTSTMYNTLQTARQQYNQNVQARRAAGCLDALPPGGFRQSNKNDDSYPEDRTMDLTAKRAAFLGMFRTTNVSNAGSGEVSSSMNASRSGSLQKLPSQQAGNRLMSTQQSSLTTSSKVSDNGRSSNANGAGIPSTPLTPVVEGDAGLEVLPEGEGAGGNADDLVPAPDPAKDDGNIEPGANEQQGASAPLPPPQRTWRTVEFISKQSTVSRLEDQAVDLNGPVSYSEGVLNGFLDQAVDPLQPMTFSKDALKCFSLALGSQGHGLKVLVLDHNKLGDLGMQLLYTGLKRCSTLTHLSLSDCGLGHVAAYALAAVLVPDATKTATQPPQPQLQHLNISKNPLGGAGLAALCEGFATCKSLKVLNLSSCLLTEDDVPALEQFATALQDNPSIINIDLESNFFGDEGAKAFFPILSCTKHVRKLRVSPRGLSRDVGAQLVALIKQNLPKKKVVKKKAAKK